MSSHHHVIIQCGWGPHRQSLPHCLDATTDRRCTINLLSRMVRLLRLVNLASVWWWGVTHIPTFFRTSEAFSSFETGSDFNSTFPKDFSKHIYYSNVITNVHLAYIHLLLFLLGNKWIEKVNAVGQIVYWYYGIRWLFDTYPVSKEYKYEEFKTPASQFIYAVPILYAICLLLDCTVEVVCTCWYCKGRKEKAQ